MNEPELKHAAFALAEATSKHLDQPTTPPIHWRLEGDPQNAGTYVLRVLLADGRTVRSPYSAKKVKAAVETIMALPTRSLGMPTTGYMPLTPDPSPKKMGEGKTSIKSPAKHKAGK